MAGLPNTSQQLSSFSFEDRSEYAAHKLTLF